MIRPPPRSTRSDTLFPYTPLFRSKERLNDLLNLATIHLLPQKADAADLLLPSKLTNMLASGRPVVAGTAPHTGLAREMAACGLAVVPELPAALARSEERRVGKECVSKCSSRWSPYH